MNGAHTVGIAGTGLIGASIGLRARELGWRVVGFDADPDVCERARELGALDACTPLEALYESCDTVVLAMHTSGTLRELDRLRAAAPAHASLIIDVASVKAPVTEAAQGIAAFVATHPMAGAERSGPGAARATLFSDKPWLYVRPAGDALNARAVHFLAALGARPVAIDAAEHDARVALTSHVPQVLATLFAARIRDNGGAADLDPYCGPTARELLRLSRSSVAMWRDILDANNVNVAAELRQLAQALLEAAAALERGDSSPIEANFTHP